jgi:hypothetical protein
MAGCERWVFTLLVVIGLILLWVKWRWRPSATHRVHPKPSPRPRKPGTPDDCPREACRVARPIRPPSAALPIPYVRVEDPHGPLHEKPVATAGCA